MTKWLCLACLWRQWPYLHVGDMVVVVPDNACLHPTLLIDITMPPRALKEKRQ